MKIEFLKEFVAIARTRSFVRASEMLYISQSALSRHIQTLESELGARLLNRDPHDVSLTDAGSVFLADAQNVIAAYDTMMSNLSDHLQGFVGELRIGMLYYAIDDFMPPILNLCAQRHPGLKLHLSSHQPVSLYNDLQSGAIDLGLVCYRFIDEPEIVLHSFAQDGVVAMMDRSHPLATRDDLELSDLTECDLAFPMLPIPTRIATDYDDVLRSAGLVPQPLEGCTNIDLIPSLIRGTEYVVPNPAAMAGMPARDIAMVPIGDLHATMSFAYRKDNRNPAIDPFLCIVDDAYGL